MSCNVTEMLTPIRWNGAGRSTTEELGAQSRIFETEPLVVGMMDCVPAMLVVVNERREMVFANKAALRALKQDMAALRGKRPGELLDCQHAATAPRGCGTDGACTMCGAARALKLAEEALASTQECRIRQQTANGALDLRVSSAPIEVQGTHFTVMSLTDVSDESRRKALERIFFHDLLNTVGALSGYVQLLEDGSTSEDRRYVTDSIARLTETLSEEIRSQRDLAAAENNDLAVRREVVHSKELLEELAVNFRNHTVSHGRRITVGSPCEAANLNTDRRLLLRVLGNMLKNALEATPPGGDVTLSCAREGMNVIFRVHNAGFIPLDVQVQVFNRTYSTKGNGRGLGTYSMKLLGERYLGGLISFNSTRDAGTIFSASFPGAA